MMEPGDYDKEVMTTVGDFMAMLILGLRIPRDLVYSEKWEQLMEKTTSYALTSVARDRIGKLLDMVAVEVRNCKRCGRKIWFLATRDGKKNPYTDDAVSHFADCPNVKEFKR